jgi:hypothetical protein
MTRVQIETRIGEYSKRQSETKDAATYWMLESILNTLRWALLDNPA